LHDVNTKAIWVVDPGMMEAGGHHAALAETLCQSKNRLVTADIQVFASKQLDKNLRQGFSQASIKSNEVFDCHFYQHFDDNSPLGPAGMQHYIRGLASEYIGVLLLAIEQAKTKAVIFFLPCLNWEHANAFSLASKMLEHTLCSVRIHVVACAMYSPRAFQGDMSASEMWFAMAFKGLMKLKFVSLYGSDYELCKNYGHLLLSAPLAVHPCYLMDWKSIEKPEAESAAEIQKAVHYLLYLGDAKENKGFNRLPKILEEGLKNTPVDTKFIIQFTLAWEYPEIMETVRSLKRWAENEPRLILHHGFWSNEEVLSILGNIKGAVCTYDTAVYQHKSSGLVWMLAFLNKPFLISANCWLSREAERLNLDVCLDPNLAINSLGSCSGTTLQQVSSSEYKQVLFSPLIEWLVSH
jgi:hypothetical protein